MNAADYLKANGPDIAAMYAQMRHTPDAPLTRRVYTAFIGELLQQFDSMRQTLTVHPWTLAGQPYADSAAMMADIRDNRHLYVYTDNGDMPDDHPMQEHVSTSPSVVCPWSANMVFRAVHDYYGHALQGYTFSPVGEECAYRAHRLMFSHTAVFALACETRAQSCAFNYGPHASIARPNRPYPNQKAGILPSFVVFSD